jgi:integrase
MASVQKHGNRWRVKWHVDGRALYDSFPTKKDAVDAARRIEAKALIDGAPPLSYDDNALTLAKWWARWEPGREWATSTRESHRSRWANYISPVFGRVAVDAITTADIRKWHRKLEARGLAPGYIAAIHLTLSAVLQGAVDDEIIVRNPARQARLRRSTKTPPIALDREQTAAFLDAVAATTPRLAPFARFVAVTGLRRAEAAGVTWDRVDLDGGVLVVDRQLDYPAPRQPAWAPTKTGKTRRVLLTGATVALLREHRATEQVVALAGLVFTNNGEPWGRKALARGWHRAADLLDEQGTPLPAGARGWHTLRHTVASRLLEAGVPPAEAAQMLGHSPAQLLTIYAHVVDRAAADARLRAALS